MPTCDLITDMATRPTAPQAQVAHAQPGISPAAEAAFANILDEFHALMEIHAGNEDLNAVLGAPVNDCSALAGALSHLKC